LAKHTLVTTDHQPKLLTALEQQAKVNQVFCLCAADNDDVQVGGGIIQAGQHAVRHDLEGVPSSAQTKGKVVEFEKRAITAISSMLVGCIRIW
jgi:hypothetical protein